MGAFASKLDTGGEAFVANRQEMLSLMDEYREIKSRAEALSER